MTFTLQSGSSHLRTAGARSTLTTIRLSASAPSFQLTSLMMRSVATARHGMLRIGMHIQSCCACGSGHLPRLSLSSCAARSERGGRCSACSNATRATTSTRGTQARRSTRMFSCCPCQSTAARTAAHDTKERLRLGKEWPCRGSCCGRMRSGFGCGGPGFARSLFLLLRSD